MGPGVGKFGLTTLLDCPTATCDKIHSCGHTMRWFALWVDTRSTVIMMFITSCIAFIWTVLSNPTSNAPVVQYISHILLRVSAHVGSYIRGGSYVSIRFSAHHVAVTTSSRVSNLRSAEDGAYVCWNVYYYYYYHYHYRYYYYYYYYYHYYYYHHYCYC